MTDSDLIMQTLEQVAEKHGDPTPKVYERLFAERPDLKDLFLLDVDGGVRGSMLQQALECLIGQAEGSDLHPMIVSNSRFVHDGYGVPAETFMTFFATVRDTFRDLMGPDWTQEHEAAWAGLVGEMERI